MRLLGPFATTLALALALYGAAASIAGARRRSVVLVESGRMAAFGVLVAVATADAAMLAAIVGNDFSIRYVAENSSRETPLFFKVLSLWSADDGSLLLWNLILAGFVAAVAFRFRRRRPEIFPWAMAVMFSVQAFYLVLVSGPARPFGLVDPVPGDGRGPMPLLQNHPLMAVHPPFLYMGFIGLTVPFGFAVAALITGSVSDRWLQVTRRWALFSWVCLTVGLLLGALWSYGVLGWGGYWAWDPVENVALLPWLTITAFLHSTVIQQRRGMLKVWNQALVIGAFALTTFGTFLTRGSILSSIHSFAQSLVGPMYLGFLMLVLGVGFGLVVLRAPRLRSAGRIDAVLSREAAFLGNNLALLALTSVVLLGTLFPLVVQSLGGGQVSVGAPYFEQATAPIFLFLLAIACIGPVLAWRRSRAGRLLERIALPSLAGLAAVLGLAVGGVRDVPAVLAVGLATTAGLINVSEIWRRTRAHARRGGRGMLGRSLLDAAARNRRLYGGLVAHIGLAVAAVAVTVSTSFAHQLQVSLVPGQAASFSGYSLRYEGSRTLEQPQRRVLVTDIVVERDGEPAGRFKPSLNFYPSATEPIGTPSIRYGLFSDLYASLIGVGNDGDRATFRFFYNPGVMWLWVGGGIMAIGGLSALLPERRRRAPAPAPLPTHELVEVAPS